jgi:hypothetical protein
MKKQCISLFALLSFSIVCAAQGRILDAGIRFQQTINLYNENGFALAMSPAKKRHDKLYFGFSYVTSRLGSAINSNAIKQDNILLSAAWLLRRNHIIRPFGRLNAGFFNASYGNKLFEDLPHTSPLVSPELGISFETNLPLKISTSLGYNLITGDGTSGPGTLFPAYYQLTFSWNILPKKKAGSETITARKRW